ncbi:hypothetical protein TrVE_jg6491 [Triparma verrucosa]|uniref:WW domain-containing protein n=1 Tax=Triparma verrucosa TaxID=1606542 RepID=A0A9W7B912_9STRA|nr:hypothetical protein TrVE_jg6491 [Triparma verrucosa]
MIVSSKDQEYVYYAYPTRTDDRTTISATTDLTAQYVGSSTSFSKVRSISIGSLTSNLFPDVAVGDENSIVVLKNAHDGFGMGGFNAPVEIGSCQGARAVKVVDLDGDGCNDIVAACKDAWEPKFFRSKCRASLTSDDFTEISLGQPTFGSWENFNKIIEFEVADLDGDGNNDVVYGNEKGNAGVLVFLFTYSGDTVTQVKKWVLMDGFTSIAEPEEVQSVAICDVDGDGDLDIVSLSRGDVFVYHESRLNEGWTTSSSESLFKQPVVLTQASADINDGKEIRCKDLDGDGYPELSLADKNGGIKIIQNLGPSAGFCTAGFCGFASDPAVVSSVTSDGEFANLIDMDRDGFLDIVFGAPSQGEIRAIYNAALCPAGKYLNKASANLYTGGVCTSCQAGRYTASDNKQESCHTCEAGKSSSAVGASSYPCVACDANEYSASDGAAACSDCSYPQVGSEDRTQCITCGNGKFVSSMAAGRTCVSCDVGKFSDGTQTAGTCASCPSGRYSGSPGSTSCVECGANTFSNEGADACQACGAGKFYRTISGTKMCTNCLAGKIQPTVRQTGLVTDCEDCGSNTFVAVQGAIACAACEMGTFSNPGASVCEVCSAGTYYSSNPANGMQSCMECPLGTYQEDSGKFESCDNCPPGRYQDETGGMSMDCKKCPPGTSQPYEKAESSDNCYKCDEGKYSPNLGSSYCTECEAGKFQPSLGGNACVPCDEGKSSGVGASLCSGIFITSVVPNSGSTNGGEWILIKGAKLEEAHVKIGPVGSDAAVCSDIRGNSTQIMCKTPEGSGRNLDVTVTKNDGSGELVQKGAFSYDIPRITSIRGCQELAYAETLSIDGSASTALYKSANCPTTGKGPGGDQVVLTISGGNFGAQIEDIDVAVDDQSCSQVRLTSSHDGLECNLPYGTGEAVGVTVTVSEQVGVSYHLLSYSPPTVTAVAGCTNVGDATTDCPRVGGVTLNVTGNFFGPNQPIIMIGGEICSGIPPYDGDAQNEVLCALPPGSGSLKGINVIQINGLISEGVSLLSYKMCMPGSKNVLNRTLGYFECLPCEPGHYSTIEESFTCTQCLRGSYLENPTTCTMCSTKVPNSLSTRNGAEGIDSCVCPRRTYFDASKGSSGACISCDGLRGVSCNLPGQRLETLQIKPGFWRSSPTSTSIKRCYNNEACIGTVNASAHENSISDSSFNSTEELISYCAEGYEGPYCDVCSQGYSGSFGSCRKCKGGGGSTANVVWTVILLVIALAGLLFMGWTVQKFSKKSKKALLIGGKLFISTVQILMAIPEVFEVVLPKNFLEFLSYFNIFNFGFIEIFDIGCSVNVNVHHLMLSATLIPLFMILPILAMWLYHYVSESNESSFRSRQALKMNTVSLLLSMSYFFLPGSSMSIFAIYPCDKLDDGSAWLKNDYSINCGDQRPDDSHDFYKFYGYLMLCVYPIGIPLLYTSVLTKDRSILNPKERKGLHPLNRRGQVYDDWEEKVITEREQNDTIQHTVFLWGSYRPKAWWFEIFECVRRLALTGALVFVRQGSQTQIALGCVICICAGLIFALTWPYATFRDNVLGILSHCQLIGTLFSAMMYKLGKNAELAYDQEASGWMLIALNGTVFIIMLGWVGFEVFVDEGPSLRSRERQFLAQASFLLSGGSVRGRFMATGQSVTESNVEMTTDFSSSSRNINNSAGGISSGASTLNPGLADIYSNRDSVGSGILEVEDNPIFAKKSGSDAKKRGSSVTSRPGGGGRGLSRNSSTRSAATSKQSLFGKVKLAKSKAEMSSSNLSESGGGDTVRKASSSRSGSSASDSGSVGGRIEEGLEGNENGEEKLPAGWKTAYDEASSAWYYWNIDSGETVWDRPV